MTLPAVKALCSTLLAQAEEEYLLHHWHVIVVAARHNGVSFTANTNKWCVVPRWVIQATYDFCEAGGYADMQLGEFLARLVEEHDE